MEDKSIQEIRDDIEAQMKFLGKPLFISIAAPNPDWHLNAWLHVDWDVYAEGYKKGGDILVQYVIDNDWYQDFLVYPIVFLYRQYLELRLKELIHVSSRLLDQNIDIPRDHNLLSLWSKVSPNIEQVWPDSQTKKHLEAIKARLEELCSIDPRSYAFRYPEDTEGEPNLAGMGHINLRRLKDVVQAISNVLDGSSIGMAEYLNAKHEMMAEYRAEMAQHGEYY